MAHASSRQITNWSAPYPCKRHSKYASPVTASILRGTNADCNDNGNLLGAAVILRHLHRYRPAINEWDLTNIGCQIKPLSYHDHTWHDLDCVETVQYVHSSDIVTSPNFSSRSYNAFSHIDLCVSILSGKSKKYSLVGSHPATVWPIGFSLVRSGSGIVLE